MSIVKTSLLCAVCVIIGLIIGSKSFRSDSGSSPQPEPVVRASKTRSTVAGEGASPPVFKESEPPPAYPGRRRFVVGDNVAAGVYGDFIEGAGLAQTQAKELGSVLSQFAEKALSMTMEEITGEPLRPSESDVRRYVQEREAAISQVIGPEKLQEMNDYSLTLGLRGIATKMAMRGDITMDSSLRQSIFNEASKSVGSPRDYEGPASYQKALVEAVDSAAKGRISGPERDSLVGAMREQVERMWADPRLGDQGKAEPR